MGRVERHRDLTRFDQFGIDQADRLPHARTRSIGTNQNLRGDHGPVGQRCQPIRRQSGQRDAEAAIGAGLRGARDEFGVENGAVDHAATKIFRQIRRIVFDTGQHRGDGLAFTCRRDAVAAQCHGQEFGALHGEARAGLAIDANHLDAGACGPHRGRASGGAEPNNQNIGGDRFAHAAHDAAGFRLPPTFIEQQACCCCAGRPIISATATAPSAGKAMPSSPAITA